MLAAVSGRVARKSKGEAPMKIRTWKRLGTGLCALGFVAIACVTRSEPETLWPSFLVVGAAGLSFLAGGVLHLLATMHEVYLMGAADERARQKGTR